MDHGGAQELHLPGGRVGGEEGLFARKWHRELLAGGRLGESVGGNLCSCPAKLGHAASGQMNVGAPCQQQQDKNRPSRKYFRDPA